MVDGADELLISLSTKATGTAEAMDDPLAPVFRVTSSQCSLTRVRRWREEGTALRAYVSKDGAVMLADPLLGGMPPANRRSPLSSGQGHQAIPQDHAPTEDK